MDILTYPTTSELIKGFLLSWAQILEYDTGVYLL